MAEDSDLERTEAPSARRLEKARSEGRVPQSRELTAFLVLASATAGFWILGGWFMQQAGGILRLGLSFDRSTAFDPSAMTTSFATLSWQAMLLAAPIFTLTAVAAIATPFAMGGWNFSPEAMSPNLAKLDPIKGVQRMFSWHSVGELVKAVLKALLIGGVIYWVIQRQQGQLFALILQSLEPAMASFGHMVVFAMIGLVAGLALIAAIDVPFQLWRYYAGLRMTKEEVRQEMKEMEGDPHLKARIRSQQREMARKRMMAEVPRADVVVTNPTHFAVALKYDRERMGAPQVVAKGMSLVAQKIRELAADNNVPVVEAPPLARALYRHTDIGEQVPTALYTAVAEILAYVYQLNQHLATGAGVTPPLPPRSVSVPDGMDPGEPAGAVA
ncbi:MAG: flagellar type III secretion system protein FlhB [Rhodocyclales bacterium]|nr:flagellar type III secretion system protein FlhB [Rhodocyclales bacterium]